MRESSIPWPVALHIYGGAYAFMSNSIANGVFDSSGRFNT